ncbi:MAG TPA: alpha/beta fold hydrolase, partial [Acidimicrobiales bacterium]|nr:alpha/beta fold hydrolase [Acidimicrobiales bacterium]
PGAGPDVTAAGGTGAGRGTTGDVARVRYRTVHGYRRAYRMAGRGPAVLLLHGIGDSSVSWLPVMDDLARDHTVIAPDLLGHGESDKPRADYAVAAYANGMRDLLDILGVERATIVGHSLGGGVAAQMSYQFPERCERLVLVASGGAGRDVTPLLRLAAAPLAEVFLAPLRWPGVQPGMRLALDVLGRLGHDLGRDRDHVARIVGALPDGRAQVAFTRTLRSVVDWRGQVVTLLDRCYLAESVPTLLVWGERDGVIPVAHARRAHAAMSGSRLEVFPGAGHFPHHADPARFAALLAEFMATTEPATYDPDRWRDLLRRGPAAGPAERPGGEAATPAA